MRAWDPDEGDEDGADTLEGHDPQRVAEAWAELDYSRSDYPMTRKVAVRDHEGNLHTFQVTAETRLVFDAERIP